jgi:diketogulonate reductase-like aldo/keto reductase
MEKLQLSGKAKTIGVSNFDRKDVEVILKTAKIKPGVNQIEYHPYHPRVSEKYIPWLQIQGIAVEAFFGLVSLSDIGKGGPLDEPLAAIAKDHNVDPAVVLQRWLLQQNVVSLNTTSKEKRVAQGFGALKIELSEKEMTVLSTVGQSGEGYPKSWVGPSGFQTTDSRQY